MDLQSVLSTLMSSRSINGIGSLGFPFGDASILTAALATSNLDSPINIVPYETATIPQHCTPTKKIKREEPSISPVSSHSSTVSSTNFTSPQQSPVRKAACPIPSEKKDDAYFERRRKNNDAAKRSRDARRQKEEAIAAKAAKLEQENTQLKGQVAALQQETAKLQFMLITRHANELATNKTTTNNNDSHNNSSVEV